MDLIPLLSFVLLKGKCRYCKNNISWQYPLVELGTAILFILGFFKYFNTADLATSVLVSFIAYLIYCSFLIIIFVYDLKHYLILDKIVLPAVLIAFLFNFSLGVSLFNLLLASIIVAGFFLFQFIVSRGKWIGGGDIRLGFLMGAILGWPNAIVALLLAYVMGSIISLLLIAFKLKKWGDHLPFGTFLSLATVLTILYGTEILNWYINLVRL